MHIPKFTMVPVAIILSTILGISLVMSQLKTYYTIPSSGSIVPTGATIPDYEGAYYSEMRAVFLHFTSLGPGIDMNLVAQTLNNYGIQMIVIETMTPRYAAYPSNVIALSAGLNVIDEAISAFHPLGIEVYIAMDVLFTTATPEHGCIDHLGNFIDWTCPSKQASRDYLKAIVEEVITKYPEIDGFMFDYTRWEWQGATPDMCYCDECKSSLETYLGENITNFPGDFAPGGSRYDEFLEWRIIPITQIMADMIGWMKAIKPDLKISASPWGMYIPEGPAEVIKLIGQDWPDWVMKGYLDWVAPMIYFSPDQLNEFRQCAKGDLEIGVGGPEGKIPMMIFVANQYPILKTPEQFKAEIDILRQEGLDGWIIWKYGGPGIGGVDISNYLDALELYPIFSLKDITVYGHEANKSATITWTTTAPTTSKVEYSTSPLFSATLKYDLNWTFNYWDIDHAECNVVENLQKVVDHSITLTNLDPNATYYFRVQSQDSEVATSKVYKFSISDISG